MLALKIPPPVVALCIALLMWRTASIMTWTEMYIPYRVIIAFIFVVAGLTLDLVSVFSFMKIKTTINPLKPTSTSTLVNTGIYQYTRNPMYLGQFLVLLGWGVYLANAAVLLFLPLFVLYINRFQIAPEERILTEKFGTEFNKYKASVRRWL